MVVRVFAVELCESSESGEEIHGSWPAVEEGAENGVAVTVCVYEVERVSARARQES